MKKQLAKLALTAALGLALAFTACDEKKTEKPVVGTFTDTRDNKTYKTAKISKQVWMAENLNYKDNGGWCVDNEESNCQKYGRLYEWSAGVSGICPSGWHLPTKEEWDELIKFVGGEKIAGHKLKASSGWTDYTGESYNGDDAFGFSALPGGHGDGNDNSGGIGSRSLWWLNTNSNASTWSIGEDSSVFYKGFDECGESVCAGYVRCIQSNQ